MEPSYSDQNNKENKQTTRVGNLKEESQIIGKEMNINQRKALKVEIMKGNKSDNYLGKHDSRGIFKRNLDSIFDPYIYESPKSNTKNLQYSEGNPLISLTHNIINTYKRCNEGFNYKLNFNPKRSLTKPSIPTYNDGYDNENNDLIIYVNTILGANENQKYIVIDILGQGTFGQVVRCQNLKTKEHVAIKIIKGKQAYFNQSMMEITILELLNQHYDPKNNNHLIRLLDTFIYRKHLCLVFELLSVSLYDLIKQNKFRGLSPNLIKVFAKQILEGLVLLGQANIIHADLKPENILLKNLDSPELKIIDFGSACHEHKTLYTYIQSRFYRSPEVILGLPYSSSIDMWSVGCILIELFLGLPLFPGTSEYNQLSRIIELLGNPPPYMIDFGKNSSEYFNKIENSQGSKTYQLKSIEQYTTEQGSEELPSKRYFPLMSIQELIRTYPITKKNISQQELQKENEERIKFTDFVLGFLNLNPIERWSPQQALLHPFVTGEPYFGHFNPPTIPRNTLLDPIHLNNIYNNEQNVNSNNIQLNQPIPDNILLKNQDKSRYHSNNNQSNVGELESSSTFKANKGRSRARANTVNVSMSDNVPFNIKQASAVASAESHINYQKIRPYSTKTIKQNNKNQKRFSMPNPDSDSFNLREEDNVQENDVDQEFSLMEAGFSKFGISSSINKTKQDNELNSKQILNNPLERRDSNHTSESYIRNSTSVNKVSNKSGFNSPSQINTLSNSKYYTRDHESSHPDLRISHDHSNRSIPIHSKSSSLSNDLSNNYSYMSNSIRNFSPSFSNSSFGSPSYSNNSPSNYITPNNTKSPFSNRPTNSTIHTHSKNKSFNDFIRSTQTYDEPHLSHNNDFQQFSNLQSSPKTHNYSTINNKSRRTYSFGWEATLPNEHKSRISHISDLPSHAENKRAIYPTRSISYSSSTSQRSDMQEYNRTLSMDATIPYPNNEESKTNPIRGTNHHPAYLKNNLNKQEPTQSPRRYTMDSSNPKHYF